MAAPITLGNNIVPPGERKRVELTMARLPTGNWMSLPIEVVNGVENGPRLWISSAVHGDEINGVEIIRRVLEKLDAKTLSGAVIAVPIVNVFGFVEQSRYLPDRRDLNRSFPGSPNGSLASRLAHLFLSEVVSLCTYGIDLHTGSDHRTNLPQIRCNLHNAETRRCAESFRAPIMVHSEVRNGSLRQAATGMGIHVLVYEAGEPLRFDEEAIQLGVRGILRVLAALGMRDRKKTRTDTNDPQTREITHSSWIRAKESGILRMQVELGQHVPNGHCMGKIADAFGDYPVDVVAPFDGVVIGHTNNPLVHQGDGIIHLAQWEYEEE